MTSAVTQADHFYPRPPRGGRHRGNAIRVVSEYISIHALREEGDVGLADKPQHIEPFLSTPSARRATVGLADKPQHIEPFLSTPSARRATPPPLRATAKRRNFYPRPPRGGRRDHPQLSENHPQISIHALREEGDFSAYPFFNAHSHFYPRPPRGGRPEQRPRPAPQAVISIHALREEGDGDLLALSNSADLFLSTPSARRATVQPRCAGLVPGISIHALREEGDPKLSSRWTRLTNFYPRPPRGGRLCPSLTRLM